MRAGGGKAKGGQFERDMARKLSLWLTDGKKDDCLWRSAGSGSMSTNSIKRGTGAKQYQASDLSPNAPEAYLLLDRFTIECKYYANLQLDGLLFNPKCQLLTFWKQSNRDAASVSKRPFLIAKQNRRPIMVGIEIEVLAKIGKVPTMISVVHANLALVLLDDFLQHIKPTDLNWMAPNNATPRPARQRLALNRKP